LSSYVVIVTFDAAATAALRRILAQRIAEQTVVVHESDLPLRAAIDGARRIHGAVPIAVVARTRPEAIDAIEAGADEAMAIAPGDRGEVAELLDRARLRGAARASTERERVEVAQAEKLAALGTLVAGVAHEVNNPLGALVLMLDMLPTALAAAGDLADLVKKAALARGGLTHEEVARLAALAALVGDRHALTGQAEDMRASVRVIEDVVKDLRVFARIDADEAAQVVDVHELLEHLLRLVGREIHTLAVVERDLAEVLPPVLVPQSRLAQVLTNVLVNATHAMREQPRAMHRLRIVTRADESMIAVSIADTGPGIAPDAIERIFDPFFTTKRANLGTGLGLSISRNLMRAMGGDLLVESVHGEGATFVLLVPRPSDAELRAARMRSRIVPGAPVASTRRISVMVVGDDDHLVRAYTRVLGRRYDILVAADAHEAVEMLAAGSHADVVLADVPARDAETLRAWLETERPDLTARAVFVTDDPSFVRATQTRSSDVPVLTKPTASAVLVRAIEEAAAR
jgi:signal transduction histidine kinase/CheY-like chemotaxis protein